MRHNQLLAVAHNYADSLACGLGLAIGYYPSDVFGEAAGNPDFALEVDFLSGKPVCGVCTADFAKALEAYKSGFGAFCERNRVQRSDFRQFRARYVASPVRRSFTILVEDRRGKTSTREFAGIPGQRVKVLDHLRRLRPKKHSSQA
jgi:hypothetical protein